MKVNIVYWSGTGNTEAMANLIRQGAESKGAEVQVKPVDQAQDADLNCDILALGCPSMGEEELEETEFEPYFASLEKQLAGRRLALFGSYGWGDGEWMEDWTKRARDLGAELVATSLVVNEGPEGDEAQRCREYGAALVG
ncbi:MAG: flavodoxin [Coriobacteriales bacterium]|jgi:flavodoxin short chain|nr:flavodoxin [Coriobacteriales bacterium]